VGFFNLEVCLSLATLFFSLNSIASKIRGFKCWTGQTATWQILATFGYYQELNPLRARLPLIKTGYIPTENSINCELGFGQGISTNIHAAASNNSWYANDFMPDQALFAKNLANASGANAYLSDEAFVEFCKRPDLPDFDFIGLHGIWSWINEENRKIIVEFIRRKLKVGGVLYVATTQPGWAAMAPFRDFFSIFAKIWAYLTRRNF
jgi:hypothetical protein